MVTQILSVCQSPLTLYIIYFELIKLSTTETMKFYTSSQSIISYAIRRKEASPNVATKLRSFSSNRNILERLVESGKSKYAAFGIGADAESKNGILNPYMKQGTSVNATTLRYFREDLFKHPTSFNRFISKTQNIRFAKIDLLEKLADAHIEQLEHNVTAITIDSLNPKPIECRASPKTLYERWWYEKLLEAIMQKDLKESTVLIGSEGTSKSTFQFWFLYRILQAFHHGKCSMILPMLRTLYSRQLKSATSRDETKVESLINGHWWDSDSTLGSYLVHWDPKIKYIDVKEDEIVDIDFADRTTKFASSHIYEIFGHVCRVVG